MIVAAATAHVVMISLTHAISHVDNVPELASTAAPRAAVPAASSEPTVTELSGAAATWLMASIPVDIVAARAAHIRARIRPTAVHRAR